MKIVIITLLIITFCFTSPMFGQKYTNRATIDDNFCGTTVIVGLDKKVGAINKNHEKTFFRGVDTVTIS